MIKREIFLEYTRKMSLKKHCLHRVHISEITNKKVNRYNNFAIGSIDPKIQNKEITLAKNIPFSKALKEKLFTSKGKDYQKILNAILTAELKNDAIINFTAEELAKKCKGTKYVHFYYGVYEIPQKRIYEQGSSNSVIENESGEIYPHLICVLTDKNDEILHGFLYPAYREDRYGDKTRYDYI